MTSPASARAPEPRLAPIPFAEWDDRARAALLPHLRRSELYLSGAPDAPPMPVVMELFAHHLQLGDTFMAFTDVLASADSTLEPADRELLILRVAWRTRSGYEWNQHHRMGGEVGLTEAQLAAVPDGADASVWTARQGALLRAVDEMIDEFGVGQVTWDQLAAEFEPAQLFELLFVIGGYLCLAGVLTSLGLRGELTAGRSGTGAAGGGRSETAR
jgi:4-carboxymuconolactone decarboxylase